MRMTVAIIPIVVAAACTSSAPSFPPTAPSMAPTEPAPRPTAELEITSFEMKYLRFELGFYVYAPEITLTEKSGRSPARFKPLEIRLPNGNTDQLAGICRDRLEVPAGGTWKLTDLVFWCRDVDTYDISGLPVMVTIDYVDEDGVMGQVTSTAVAEAVH